MKILSVVNMKGGVAKTTVAVNIADCLCRRHGKRVLLIDIDPQFNATQYLIPGNVYADYVGQGKDTINSIFEESAITTAGSVTGVEEIEAKPLDGIIPYNIRDGFDILPGNLQLYKIEMAGGSGKENRLKLYLDSICDQYDFTIIDTPPTPSVWMSSALIASNYYLVPVKPEPLSATGIDLLRGIISSKIKNYGLSISCVGLILTIAEVNTLVYSNAQQFIREHPYWKKYLYKNFLKKRTGVARLTGEQKLILDSEDQELKYGLTGIVNELLTRLA